MDNTKKSVRPNPPVAMNAELKLECTNLLIEAGVLPNTELHRRLLLVFPSYITRYGAKLHNLGYKTAEKEMGEQNEQKS